MPSARGPAAASRTQTQNINRDAPAAVAAGPRTDSYFAYGLRPTPEGFEVVRVHMPSGEVVERVREPEPFQAIAYQYATAALMEDYMLARQK